MTIGIMQPYFFPYIGYFQLIHSVDKFIFYDDVNYIKGGWINRNRILSSSGKIQYITVPLKNASSNQKINEIHFLQSSVWKKKMIKTLTQNYSNSNYFDQIFPLIDRVLSSEFENISLLAKDSVLCIARYLNLSTKFELSSSVYSNSELKGQDRVLDICLKENTSTYINPIGGKDLYDSKIFKEKGLTLSFLESHSTDYNQNIGHFEPNLSIIDVLMNVDKEEVLHMLQNHTIH